MEFSDRERRILAELERQLTSERAASTAVSPGAPSAPSTPTGRPRSVARAAGVFGLILVVIGLLLDVGSSIGFGLLLVGWWSAPWLRRWSSTAGRCFIEAIAEGAADRPGSGGGR